MTIENSDLLARRRGIEPGFMQQVSTQKLPEHKNTAPVLTADPEMLLKMSEAMAELTKTSPPALAKSVATILQAEAEEIVENSTTEQQITHHTAKYVFLLAELTKLIGQATEGAILNNLNATIATYQAIANSFNNINNEYDKLVDQLKELEKALSAAKIQKDSDTEALKEAENTLSKLIAERNIYDVDSDEYQALTEEINTQQQIVYDKTAAAAASAETYKEMALNALQLEKTVGAKLDELLAAYNLMPIVQSSVNEATRSSAIGKYVELIASILSLIGKNNEATIDRQRALNELMFNERMKKIEEQQAQITKKSNASGVLKKIIGVFGLIAGAVLSIAGIVAAVPSAGAGSALSVIGIVLCSMSLGLLVIDAVYQCCTGFEKSMTSILMEKLTDALTKAFTKKLTETVDKLRSEHKVENEAEIARLMKWKDKVAPMLANILSTIIFMAPAILMMVFTLGGASKVAVDTVKKGVLVAQKIALYFTPVQLGANASLNTASAIVQQQITNVIAELKLTQNDIEHINQLKELLAEQLQKTSEEMMNINKDVLNVLKGRMDAIHYGVTMARNTALSA